MSLKGFHLVFITVCTLLCVFLIFWAFLLNSEPASGLTLGLGITGITGLLLMPPYAVYFYRKASKLQP
ncbi:MAG: hypothetical protein RL346_1915 [Verrucomicrobiota bacterium]|jgi:hypothetical protein